MPPELTLSATNTPGEERTLIPSRKAATYDPQPEIRTPEVTEALAAAVDGGAYDVDGDESGTTAAAPALG